MSETKMQMSCKPSLSAGVLNSIKGLSLSRNSSRLFRNTAATYPELESKVEYYGRDIKETPLMTDHHQSYTELIIPDGGILTDGSVRTILNSENKVNEVAVESHFSGLLGKSKEKALGVVCVTSNASPVSRSELPLDFKKIFPFSSFEKKMTLSSNDLPMSAGNVNPSTTDGNLQVRQTTFLEQKDKYPASAKLTPDIEKRYVHNVYDAIAPHFSATRFAKWPKVAKFLDSLMTGSVILDAGCGNGKYLGFNRNCFFIGCDISPSLINICGNRGHEVLVADALNLPYRTGFGDAAISIAVLHHLSTEERRKKAIEELVRVVNKGGKILITVWAVEQEDRSLLTRWTPLTHKYTEQWVGTSTTYQSSSSNSSLESIQEAENDNSSIHGSLNKISGKQERVYPHEDRCPERGEVSDNGNEIDESEVSIIPTGNEREQQEFFVPWHLPYHRAEVIGASASAIASGFAKKDDKKGAVVYNRYYHVFAEGELERLVSGISNAVIIDKFYDKSNWCVIIEKT